MECYSLKPFIILVLYSIMYYIYRKQFKNALKQINVNMFIFGYWRPGYKNIMQHRMILIKEMHNGQ